MITKTDDLEAAYEGSYYFIAGTGSELTEWVTGYEDMLAAQEIGKPVQWFQTTGAAINRFVGDDNRDPFPNDLVCLLFPLDGLHIAKLALFKLTMENRWFDDVVDNARGGAA